MATVLKPDDQRRNPEIPEGFFCPGPQSGFYVDAENMLQPPEHSKSTRLRLAVFGVEHAYDHYGQIVEYLRMNGMVPPASR